jgi:hypothetical protein
MFRLSFFGVTRISEDVHDKLAGRLVLCLGNKARGAAAAVAARARSANENMETYDFNELYPGYGVISRLYSVELMIAESQEPVFKDGQICPY